jgi:hypothetical protein
MKLNYTEELERPNQLTWYLNNGYAEMKPDIYMKLMEDGSLWGDPFSLQVLCDFLDLKVRSPRFLSPISSRLHLHCLLRC